MEILILAVLIGLIPAIIAQNKGHSFLLWWIFGAALFIVALPCALLINPNQGAMNRRKMDVGMRKCTACAEWISQEAKFCRYCGSEIG